MSKEMTREEFELEKESRLKYNLFPEKLSKEFMDIAVEEKYFYNFTWLGLPIIQFPQDMVAIQEIIYETEPDVIIETGLAHGGSNVLYASILNSIPSNFNNPKMVISVEKKVMPGVREDLQSRYDLFNMTGFAIVENSSIEDETMKDIERILLDLRIWFKTERQRELRIMVILDSRHTRDHVSKEIELYSPLVTVGNYLVVCDTFVENRHPNLYKDHECGTLGNPCQSVCEFLEKSQDFIIDTKIENKLVISSNTIGYLKRVK